MVKNLFSLLQKAKLGRVFINYRRTDTQWVAGRLADSLGRYFGDDRVFRDIEGIRGGADFSEVIHNTLGTADAVIVLIGEHWLDASDEDDRRRLDDPDDWVAQEIAAALEVGVPIYPVLVDDAPMPAVEDLPEDLRRLTRLNAVTVSEQRWDEDVARLAKIVSLDIPSATERQLDGLNLLISAALGLTVLVTTTVLFRNLVCHIAKDAGLPGWLSWVCPRGTDALPDSCTQEWFLSLALSGLPFLAIVPSSALLFVFARHVDESRRPLFLAAAWIGAIGALTSFILLKWICEPYEPISMWFGGTVTALLMLASMNLSGFRPR